VNTNDDKGLPAATPSVNLEELRRALDALFEERQQPRPSRIKLLLWAAVQEAKTEYRLDDARAAQFVANAAVNYAELVSQVAARQKHGGNGTAEQQPGARN
jgi:hypothetical protein